MSRLVVGPFNRVEGDLEVKLDVAGGWVRSAEVVSPLYRGFEQILHGKLPQDALVYAPRICGICSVSQSIAAARALAEAQGLGVAANGRLAIDLIHATENVADHLTHFYLFFMPDFAREAYAGESWHQAAASRFRALSGTVAEEVLPARAQWMHMMGILAGHWPHTLGIRPGGSTRAVTANEQARMAGIVGAFRRFLERTLFADTLERVANLSTADELASWREEKPALQGDFRHFLAISEALGLDRLGRAGSLFMSYGAYHAAAGHLFRRGLWKAGCPTPLDLSLITEDTENAWYAPAERPLPPTSGETVPGDGTGKGYTWCKAPRLAGEAVEVGAIARQLVNGHPLIRDLVGSGSGNVHARVVARVLEVALVVTAMESWIRDLRPGEAFCEHGATPADGEGTGLTEAARGSLGHWLKVRNGRIANYQIIAPTTWNFSPRDRNGNPGPLELALEGAPVRAGETEPLAVQHIVRSFDPCMVCTVH
ncbi:nickel-dependent hydrogenase large subunit [Mesorhizobium sp.]|uniref:nickel-dependent hydrogenase large subunit n=3 Tax=unclassified Mesorhizobium TaxID=325217 RepID=UPI000FE6028F|nr:nickel-dependent hydrogenase large subunit [Mesorhizobium sp.]RWD90886.1 MAG: HupV protein [Mesorhizobium sp.]RWD92163.1 MAG: HupV protein [Mesorhizobium sp.]TIV49169.1 MAG: HupV protein [Mesorhizobium sp.]